MEAKTSLGRLGWEAEAPGKVTGLLTCQSLKGWGQGASNPGSVQKRGTGPVPSGNHPLPAPSSFPLSPGGGVVSVTP